MQHMTADLDVVMTAVRLRRRRSRSRSAGRERKRQRTQGSLRSTRSSRRSGAGNTPGRVLRTVAEMKRRGIPATAPVENNGDEDVEIFNGQSEEDGEGEDLMESSFSLPDDREGGEEGEGAEELLSVSFAESLNSQRVAAANNPEIEENTNEFPDLLEASPGIAGSPIRGRIRKLKKKTLILKMLEDFFSSPTIRDTLWAILLGLLVIWASTVTSNSYAKMAPGKAEAEKTLEAMALQRIDASQRRIFETWDRKAQKAKDDIVREAYGTKRDVMNQFQANFSETLTNWLANEKEGNDIEKWLEDAGLHLAKSRLESSIDLMSLEQDVEHLEQDVEHLAKGAPSLMVSSKDLKGGSEIQIEGANKHVKDANDYVLEAQAGIKQKIEDTRAFLQEKSHSERLTQIKNKLDFLDDKLIEDRIDSMIDLHAADFVGKIDYAAGLWRAEIVHPVQWWWEKRRSQSPKSMITPVRELVPGDCWPMKGSKGHVTVRLEKRVKVTGVSIQHISRSIAPDYNNTLKKYRVWGKLKDVDDSHVLMLEEEYKPTKEASFEVPTIQESQLKHPEWYDTITLEILSNQGGEVTCVYRFRVHGERESWGNSELYEKDKINRKRRLSGKEQKQFD
eukprot:CAMPEP_0114510942 /NCGR_PEP_ID=MMETSP0109-20121206/14080_1 /TAXON_ID=29199 /ORGANISM="Chlorarachnion reptans, Strain CCCM449" /LENGTH=619 /DNA_ID=CAMNT_0001690331 /DNA_START=247 /DNA_END=2106 /DNA_ORIENTATION=+